MVGAAVDAAGVTAGTCTVFVPHTTVGVTALEFEPGANRDLGEVVERLVPQAAPYHHNVMDSNGHAHARAAIMGPSVSVPVLDGRLALGTWQSVVLVDFDDRPRERTVYVQVQG
ncbi:MAG: secondary thiamine-phosphate synthase enzyme YjbQ [Acidimicrobiia bacterium]|nr:secondary thiamine-phosphate synthase enzyme YjbQ [Acidimicrobiia bacterium]